VVLSIRHCGVDVRIGAFMKSLFTLFIFLFLQGCTTLETLEPRDILPNSVPNVWQAEGRISVIIDEKLQSSSFEITFKGQEFKLTLLGLLGFGQIAIHSSELGLSINKTQTSLSLKQWMNRKLGWYFPLEKLGNIIFKHSLNESPKWRTDIKKFTPYQGANLAKLVALQHRTKPIKIKLLFKEIRQLK
jgi:hypothetical protein